MNRFSYFRILVAALLAAFHFHAQTSPVDSLRKLLSSAVHDTDRCRILSEMIELENDEQKWPVYNQTLKDISQKGLKNTSQNIKKFQKYYAQALSNEALTFQMKGDIPTALDVYNKALKMYETCGDPTGSGSIMNNIGFIHYSLGDLKTALECFQKSLEQREKTGRKEDIAKSHCNIGGMLHETGKTDEALSHYKISYDLYKETGDAQGLAYALSNIAGIYSVRQENKKALTCYREAFAVQKKIGDRYGMVQNLNNLSSIVFRDRNYSASLKYSMEALELAKDMGFPRFIRDANKTAYQACKAMKDFTAAYKYYKGYLEMRDSISNVNNQKAAIKSQMQFEFERKAAADSVKRQEEVRVKNAQLAAQVQKVRQENLYRNSLVAGLVLVAGGLLFVLNRMRVTRRQRIIIENQKRAVNSAYEQLNQKNQEVLDSIYYARRIQQALITSEWYIEKHIRRLNSRARN